MCDPFGYESEDIACKFMRQKLFKVTWKHLTLMCAGCIKISFEDEGYNFLLLQRKLGSEDFEEIVADFLR